jgi:hypothetical protein
MANDVFDISKDIRVQFEVTDASAFILGLSKLNGVQTLGSSTAATWTDVVTDVVQVEIDRGTAMENGIYSIPKPGSAQVQVQSDYWDPYNNPQIHAGTYARIQFRPDPDTDPTYWLTLFTGRVKSFNVTYDAFGNNLITFNLVDYLQEWINERLGDISQGYEPVSYGTLFNVLGVYWPNVDVVGTFTATSEFPDYTETELTVGDVINELNVGELGFVYAGQNGGLRNKSRLDIRAELDLGADFYFSTVHSTSSTHVCMTDLVLDSDSTDLPNTIKATKKGTTSVRVKSNQDAKDLYGSIRSDVELNLYTADDMSLWLDFATAALNINRVKAVSHTAINRDGTVRSIVRAERLYKCVNVYYNKGNVELDDDYLITRVVDTITPDSWDVTLELWKGF